MRKDIENSTYLLSLVFLSVNQAILQSKYLYLSINGFEFLYEELHKYISFSFLIALRLIFLSQYQWSQFPQKVIKTSQRHLQIEISTAQVHPMISISISSSSSHSLLSRFNLKFSASLRKFLSQPRTTYCLSSIHKLFTTRPQALPLTPCPSFSQRKFPLGESPGQLSRKILKSQPVIQQDMR